MTERERQLLAWIREDPQISQQALADKAGITRSSAAVHISNLMKKGYIAGRGYILRDAPYITVAGAVNLDISGTSADAVVPRDSNPGTVRTSLGGVGRNIAHNLALLGTDVHLVTAFGDDDNGHRIAENCREIGIDVSDALVIPGGRTSTYLFINDADGDMLLAVNDMDIYQTLTPQVLSGKQRVLSGGRALIVDANLPAESLAYLADTVTVPIFADPVSTVKAEKLKPLLGKLHTLKPNRMEAELLSGVSITDEASLRKAAEVLLSTGLRRVFLSLGSSGVFAADHQEALLLPPLPGEAVNTTGCGDAFMAGLGWAYLQNASLHDAALAGLAASSIALEGAETINPRLSAQAVLDRIGPQNSKLSV